MVILGDTDCCKEGAHHTFPRNLPDFRSKWRPNIASKMLSEYQPMRLIEWGGSLKKRIHIELPTPLESMALCYPKKKLPQNSVKPTESSCYILRLLALHVDPVSAWSGSTVAKEFLRHRTTPCQRLALFVPKKNVDKVKTWNFRDGVFRWK